MIVIQLALDTAVHEHVEEDAVTVIDPVWAKLSSEAEVAFIVVVHGGGGGGWVPPPESPMVIG